MDKYIDEVGKGLCLVFVVIGGYLSAGIFKMYETGKYMVQVLIEDITERQMILEDIHDRFVDACLQMFDMVEIVILSQGMEFEL